MFFSGKLQRTTRGFNVRPPALWNAQEAKRLLRIKQRNPAASQLFAAASPKTLQSYRAPHSSEQ